MGNAKNRRLCWNCDGSVHIHSTKCPYCGTDLTQENPAHLVAPPPPYSVVPEPRVASAAVAKPAYEASYRAAVQETPIAETPAREEAKAEVATESPEIRSMRDVVLPMLLLLPGAFFLLFAGILFLFSSDGYLTLRWNAHYWMLYLALACPLLYFGWRTLNK